METKYKKLKYENRVKDSGDDLKKICNDKTLRKAIDGNKINIVKLNFQPDRGDSDRKSKTGEKRLEKKDQTKRTKQNLNKKEINKPKSEKFSLYQNLEDLRIKELEKRRLLREKYTFRFVNMNGSLNCSEKDENSAQNTEQSDYTDFVERLTKKQCNSNGRTHQAAATPNDSCVSESTRTDKQPDRRENVQRKPIIRTVTSNCDKAKVYKAVTFVDQKEYPTKCLQINLTSNAKKISRIPRLVDVKLTDYRTENHSLKEPVTNRKKKVKRLKRNSSPELSINQPSAPPTEVARWAPASVNPHTKPYYDAWVSTTLAAISRNAKKDKMLLNKKYIIRTIQRAIDERPRSPELTYLGLADERYAGRIKVHQRTGHSTSGNSTMLS